VSSPFFFCPFFPLDSICGGSFFSLHLGVSFFFPSGLETVTTTSMPPTPSELFFADYQSLTNGCGAVYLEDWSTILITGKDRTSFVHNLCTNDVRQLAPEGGCETFFTDVKGKIVAHVFVLALEEELLLFTVPEQAATIVNHLDRYLIREDVQLRDLSETSGWLLVSGAEASQRLQASTGFDVAQFSSPWQHAKCTVGGTEILLVRFGALWPESFLLRYSKRDKSQLQNLTDRDCGTPAWTALRVESALPMLGVDFGPTHLPQEVSRNDQAISFNKGCYLGQETIARIDALGHVNRQLVSLRFSGGELPPPGTKLLSEEKEVGEVTSSSWSPRQEALLALAMVRRGSNARDCVLESKFGQATVL